MRGITPAGAGKTYRRSWIANYEEDHPRRCGENLPIHHSHLQYLGSPPQVRGKRGIKDDEALEYRITPAGAGKTARKNGNRQNKYGSPPQVRGKLHGSKSVYRYYRITPAGAGKTIMLLENEIPQQDHPRRCGENFYSVGLAAYDTGSPPQVRGKLAVATPSCLPLRITPAGAGKTLGVLDGRVFV